MEVKTIYFDNAGAKNTATVLAAVKARAAELGIGTVVLHSVTGATAVRAVEVMKGFRLVVVTNPTGHEEPNQQEFLTEHRVYVEARDGIIYTVTPVFGGLSNAMNRRFKTLALGELVANTLTVFGNGMRNAVESMVTAADGGLVRVGESVVAIGGSEGGADTAVVCKPVNSLDFWDLRIGEIICKPRFI